MEANPLTALYTELNKLGQNSEYDRALKVCNKILQSKAGEEKAIHCKIVCMIQLARFEEAFNVIKKYDKMAGDLLFEKAYCEYRLNRLPESLKTLQSTPEQDTRMKELYAQVLYRLEQYSPCLDVYRDLVKNTQDDYEDERETNLSSVVAAMQTWGGENVDDLGLREDTYEMTYNSACFLIGKGLYPEAMDKLKKAEELCRSYMEDDPDMTPEELDEELAVIRVQRGYALQCLGRNDEALKIYNQVMKQRPSDIGLAAVASNNIVTINKDQNVFDSKKKIKVATADGLQQKLTTQQRKTIALNQCLLFMYSNRSEQCLKTASSLRSKYPDCETPTLIEAAQHVRDKQLSKAIDLLQNEISGTTDVSLNLKLTLAQLYLSQGSVYQACDSLKGLDDETYSPGIVAALVTLYLSEEDNQAAADILNQAVEWHQQNNPRGEELSVLMHSSAQFHLKRGDPRAAAALLENMKKKNPKNQQVLAQLIFAYSKFDSKKAQLVSRELPSVDEIAADLDIQALEQSACTYGQKYVRRAAQRAEGSPSKPQSPRAGTNEEVTKKKSKTKKGKLPKNIDPDGSIDPERWLPRKERSYFKGRRRDKRTAIGKGPQGTVSANSDLYDASKSSGGATGKSSEPTSPKSGPTSQPGPRLQKPASAAGKPKKKKKGGSKW